MINLEHKLTVDDLIVLYMIYKVKNGYEPSFLSSEFISFLYYFESKMPVQDALYNNEELFKRFFARKNVKDWSVINDLFNRQKIITPHMDYSMLDDDFVIKANYYLGYYDETVLNTYFMDKFKKAKINDLIASYVSRLPKRTINQDIEVDDKHLLVGKYIVADLINSIWLYYIKDLVKNKKWPIQCQDINKYLFDMDLAEVINVPSIKEQLLQIYYTVSKRIAILYQQKNSIKIGNYIDDYLSRANYDLITEGYKEYFDIAFGYLKCLFDINLEQDVDITIAKLQNNENVKMIRSIESNKKRRK